MEEEKHTRLFSCSCLFPETGEFETVEVKAFDVRDAKVVAKELVHDLEVIVDSVVICS